MSTTATAIIEASFALIQAFLPGEAIPGADSAFAAASANRMLSGWGQRGWFIPVVARERFDLVANQGTPTNPYTIGSGGDFNTTRPSNQNDIVGANLILTAVSPEVRVPLGIYTDSAYGANQVPTLSNSQPTALYYNPTYASDLGSISLWPVPDNATNDLELFLNKSLAPFNTASLGTTIYLPDGAEDAIVYALARRLQGPYGKTMSAEDVRTAIEVLGTYKRSNVKLIDLSSDASMLGVRGTVYNILSGQGG
jgi:hypothetical protein